MPKYAHELNFLTTLEKQNIGVGYLDLTTIAWSDKTKYEFILEEHDRLYNTRLTTLNQYADSLHFDKKYVQLFKNEIELQHLLGYMQPFFNVEKKEKLAKTYFDKLDGYKQWLANDTTLTSCFWYRFALLSYNMYLNFTPDDEAGFARKLFFAAKQHYSPSVAYFVQFHVLKNEEDKTSALYKECLADFRQHCPDKSYINHIDSEALSGQLSADSLVQASKFTRTVLTDINGKKLTWGDAVKRNKGKVIYTDIWASWCAPCRAEMPNSIKLQKQLPQQAYAFVYISVDNDKNKWLKAIKAVHLDKPDKQHYLLDPTSKLAKFLTPNGIPKYLIIGSKGQVIHLNSLRPSDPKIVQVLQELGKN